MKLKKKALLLIKILSLSLIFSACTFDLEKATHDLKYKKPTYINEILIVNKGIGLPSSFDPGENPDAVESFNAMKTDAQSAGLTLRAFSTYRDYDRQKYLYDNYVEKDGKEAADTYSARPGFSEHQTGLAFDIMGEDYDNKYDENFGTSKEAKWLEENAHKSGFILRYPKGKENITGRTYEPWHYRFVGVEIATEIHEKGITLEEFVRAGDNSENNNTQNNQNTTNKDNQNNTENKDLSGFSGNLIFKFGKFE